jgi:hypothetical protein
VAQTTAAKGRRKERKRPRTRRRNLRALDINENARQWASSRKGYWRIVGSWVLCYAPNAYWTNLGLQGSNRTAARDATRTAGCGPARPVVWGRRGEPGAYPIPTNRD